MCISEKKPIKYCMHQVLKPQMHLTGGRGWGGMTAVLQMIEGLFKSIAGSLHNFDRDGCRISKQKIIVVRAVKDELQKV